MVLRFNNLREDIYIPLAKKPRPFRNHARRPTPSFDNVKISGDADPDRDGRVAELHNQN